MTSLVCTRTEDMVKGATWLNIIQGPLLKTTVKRRPAPLYRQKVTFVAWKIYLISKSP